MNVVDLGLSALRLSLPLIFAAYGGLLSERSGVANIALEAYLLVSAFGAAVGANLTGSLLAGAAIGIGASGALGLFFAIVCVYGRGDQIVIGTAFNLLAAGALPTLLKSLYDVSGSSPPLPRELRFESPWPFAALAALLCVAYQILFVYGRHGLRIAAAGENPRALEGQGASFRRVRLRAVTEGALVAGIAGVYLSLCQGSGYSRDMSAGRGFIALAALIFGGWKPIPTLFACLFFGAADAVQIQLQGRTWGGVTVPNQFVQIIPYVATLVALVFFSRKMSPPAAINQDL